MKELLPLQNWEAQETSNQGICLRKGQKATYDFPHTIDLRPYDEIAISIEPVKEDNVWLTIILYPLPSGRPEFIAKTTARIRIAPGSDRVVIPFTMFDHTELVQAHMRYISHMEMELADSGSSDSCLMVKGVEIKQEGDFHVSVQETPSKVAKAGEEVRYVIQLENDLEIDCYVTVSQHRLGREIGCFQYPDSVIVRAGETKLVEVKAIIPERLPVGGYEKLILEWTPNGNGEKRQQTVLYAVRKRPHPYLLHKQDGWDRLKECLAQDEKLQDKLHKEYIEEAESWVLPEISTDKIFVYNTYSQESFLRTAVAWKLTGNEEYLKKLITYMKGLFDEEHGYFTTEGTYFIFTEHEEEFRKGTFPEHRAGSGGWIQEAEFMIKLAYGYDLIYDEIDESSGLHEKMEQLMRNYMEFESWRLIDGDGNNFQIGESTASMFFACILQDIPLMERFLTGTNGLYELLGATLSDDGSYFEGATNYIRLVLEIFFEGAVALENQDINFKDYIAQASYDKDVIHAPWAVRQDTAEDKKPFLGMSFGRWLNVEKPTRRLRDFADNMRRLLNPQGMFFSCNDSNEQSVELLMQKAYYLYGDKIYLVDCPSGEILDLLYGPHMVQQKEHDGSKSVLNTGNGFAILREDGQEFTQAVMKYGQHGGYHGHYDRMSLLSYIKDNTTFHNNEFAWFGYESFLFKMWVQTSIAHNMVVVDGKMQEPVPCECIYFEDGPEFKAVCAQGKARWSDAPYGGQTPYQLKFPEEKCKQEGRAILNPPIPREQGGIGEYSEPVFQRRLMVLMDGCIFVWDYLSSKETHTFDCLYHPFGVMQPHELTHLHRTEHFYEDPYGAGQFVLNCHWYEKQGTARLSFRNERMRVNHNDALDFVKQVELFRAYPQQGEIMVGRYPHGTDTFTNVEECLTSDWGAEDCKKTVAFRQKGTEARFVTALEVGNQEGRIESVSSDSFDSIWIQYKDGRKKRLSVLGMDQMEESHISVSCEGEE